MRASMRIISKHWSLGHLITKRGITMQRYIKSGLYSIVAGMTLALSGLTGMSGWTGEAPAANQPSVKQIQVYAQAPAAFGPILVRRGPRDPRCTRSIDNNCAKEQFPKPLPRPQ